MCVYVCVIVPPAAYLVGVPQWNGSLTLGLNFRDGSNASWAIAHLNAAMAYVNPQGLRLWQWTQQVCDDAVLCVQ